MDSLLCTNPFPYAGGRTALGKGGSSDGTLVQIRSFAWHQGSDGTSLGKGGGAGPCRLKKRSAGMSP